MRLIRRPWNDQAAAWFGRIADRESFAVADLREDVEAHGGALYHVETGGQERAALVLQKQRRRLWVVALAGNIGGLDGLRELSDRLVALARANDCDTIPLRVRRPGLIKWLRATGCEVSEVVMIKRCQHVGR